MTNKNKKKCKICNSIHLQEINEMITNGVPATDIIVKYPEFNGANVSNHKNKHMDMNVPGRLDEIFKDALSTGISKNVSVNDLIRIGEYTEKNKNNSYTDEKSEWIYEFDGRLRCLEGWLTKFHLTAGYKPAAINGFTSIEDNESDSKVSILELVRVCMTEPLVNGKIDLGSLIGATLCIRPEEVKLKQKTSILRK